MVTRLRHTLEELRRASNVGVFQAACIATLAPFGVVVSRGLAYGLLLQGIEVLCALSLGVPALLREGISWAQVRRGPRAGTDEAVRNTASI